MDETAELDISLDRREDGVYAVECFFRLPGSAVRTRMAQSPPARMALDWVQLRALAFNPGPYAAALTQSFFACQPLKAFFARAQASAESLSKPLRVRLAVGQNAPELHGVYWEALQNPEDGAPLFTGEKIFFSRYISSQDMRPVRLHPKSALSALVFIASPSNLAKYHLHPIDAGGEYRRAAGALAASGQAAVPAALHQDGPATLNALVRDLREQKPDILYVVCHGAMLKGEPYLWLESEDGRSAITSGRELITRVKELSQPPLLVVLASCDSAGAPSAAAAAASAAAASAAAVNEPPADQSAGEARSALGPGLAEAGVPAVLAMQGRLSMPTAAVFMPAFFTALSADGQVDRAVALGRGSVRDAIDAWAPVLFIRLETGCIFAEAPAAPAPPVGRWTWKVKLALAVLALALLGGLGGAAWLLTRPNPMGDGFNMAVAAFSEMDARGGEQVTGRSRAVSERLYEDIEREKVPMTAIQKFDLRGPADVPAVIGKNRAAAAQALALKINASLLIYGSLRKQGDVYVVVPEFYVSDKNTFTYGSEVAGASSLGKAVTLGPVVDAQSLAQNATLINRTRILRKVMSGLSYLAAADYPRAGLDFSDVANDSTWPETDGKEVAYLLLGAAQLLPYDPQTNPGVLVPARKSFETALKINGQYPRPYLGRGDTWLLSATIDKSPQARAGLVSQAEADYLRARDLAEKGSVTQVKAFYGLGKAALLRYDAKLPGWTAQDAQNALADFDTVIAAYGDGKEPGLAFQAGRSHYYRARLALLQGDWQAMSVQSRAAVDVLSGLPGVAIRAWVARAYEYLAVAEQNAGRPDAARNAYLQAVAVGRAATVTPEEMLRWQQGLDRYDKGTP